MTEPIKLEDGKLFRPKPHHTVECHVHGVKTTYGALDPIQRLALSEGLDTDEFSECLLKPFGSVDDLRNGGFSSDGLKWRRK